MVQWLRKEWPMSPTTGAAVHRWVKRERLDNDFEVAGLGW